MLTEFSLSIVTVRGVASLKAENRFLLQFLPHAEWLELTHPGLGNHPLIVQLSPETWAGGGDEAILGKGLKAHPTTICIIQGPSHGPGLEGRPMSRGMAVTPPWGMAAIPLSICRERPLPGQHGLVHHLFMAPGLLHPWGWPPALCMPRAPPQHLNISTGNQLAHPHLPSPPP